MKTKIIRSAIGSLASNGFLKFLKERDIYIIGTDIIDKNVGMFLCDSFYEVPKAINYNLVIEKYCTIVSKEKPSWIISGPENEIEVLTKAKDKIGCGIFHLPYKTFNIVTDKYLLAEYFKNDLIINTPSTILLQDYNDNILFTSKVVLKPRKGRGSNGVFIINYNEIELYRKKVSIADYIIQPYIEGIEYTVDTLHDFEGNLLNIVPRQRLAVESGISIVSRTIKDNIFVELISQISSKLVFMGGNCFQFIKCKNGSYYLTDINPRFGGGAILSIKSSKALADNIINLIKNKPENIKREIFSFEEMTMFRGYEEFYSK
jgi:carbamoyl-phosphate synthase large subunit